MTTQILQQAMRAQCGLNHDIGCYSYLTLFGQVAGMGVRAYKKVLDIKILVLAQN